MDPKKKWNEKYENRLLQQNKPMPNERLTSLSSYLTGGRALDIACGLGANSIFLANRSYEVHAFDISNVAIEHLKQQTAKQSLPIYPSVCDLTEIDNLDIEEASFDLVVMSYYLDRSIFKVVKNVLKDKGCVFIETFFLTSTGANQQISDHFKLLPNELLTSFKDWHILLFEEQEQEGRQTLFARKP